MISCATIDVSHRGSTACFRPGRDQRMKQSRQADRRWSLRKHPLHKRKWALHRCVQRLAFGGRRERFVCLSNDFMIPVIRPQTTTAKNRPRKIPANTSTSATLSQHVSSNAFVRNCHAGSGRLMNQREGVSIHIVVNATLKKNSHPATRIDFAALLIAAPTPPRTRNASHRSTFLEFLGNVLRT